MNHGSNDFRPTQLLGPVPCFSLTLRMLASSQPISTLGGGGHDVELRTNDLGQCLLAFRMCRMRGEMILMRACRAMKPSSETCAVHDKSLLIPQSKQPSARPIYHKGMGTIKISLILFLTITLRITALFLNSSETKKPDFESELRRPIQTCQLGASDAKARK